MAEGEKPATGTHRRMGPLLLRNGTAEPTGGHVLLHGEQREGARPDTEEGSHGVSEHTHRDVLAALQADIQRRGEPGHRERHQPGPAGLAVDRDDGTEAGEMGVFALEGTGHPLPLRNHRGGVRLLCRNDGTGTAVVAGAHPGMAVPADKGATEDVETVYHREYPVPLEHCARRYQALGIGVWEIKAYAGKRAS